MNAPSASTALLPAPLLRGPECKMRLAPIMMPMAQRLLAKRPDAFKATFPGLFLR